MDEHFELFGDPNVFAIETRLLADPEEATAPRDSIGSWGAWRIWVGGLNLCNLQIETAGELIEAGEVRWYLAPLFRWIATNWTPLLHESRLPAGGRWGDARPRWSRTAYLSMLEGAGDDVDRFAPWQEWASRHAVRSCAEGGIVPDIFFQRLGDELEMSWGDRVQPGAEAAAFVTDEGVARVPVDAAAEAMQGAVAWFLAHRRIAETSWAIEIERVWSRVSPRGNAEALSWYLDSSPTPGPLTNLLVGSLEKLKRPVPIPSGKWWSSLSPEVAMFGDLSPRISSEAAVTLLAEYFGAITQDPESDELSDLVSDEPAWATTSPWDNGYALALEVLDEADPSPSSKYTQIEKLVDMLGIVARDVRLGEEGPRGVAIAGPNLKPTILINQDHLSNSARGRRFTLAHELCHILNDRSLAKPLAHSSTPWASPSIEQRANAFAAMLLMPPKRAFRPDEAEFSQLKIEVDRLADRLEVSRVALKHHLANIGEITPYERDRLVGNRWGGSVH